MRHAPIVALVLLACSGPGESSETGETGDTGDTGEVVEERQGPPYSGAACPEMVDGWNDSFATGDETRAFRMVLPPEPTGAPVVFVWHWLGGNADQATQYLGWDTMATRENVIVIAPESHPEASFEWDFGTPDGANRDLRFFDDLLSCIWQQYDVDLDRIHATGMSAGGLWTSELLVNRSEWLASAAPLSGGANQPIPETTPIPVLLTWGGPTDTYQGYSFDNASYRLSDYLRANGHFVVHCIHSLGHRVPPGSTEWVWTFLRDHPRGVEPEPYAAGLPADFPDYCSIPD